MAFCKIMSLVNMFTSSPAMARECPWGAPRLEDATARRVPQGHHMFGINGSIYWH